MIDGKLVVSSGTDLQVGNPNIVMGHQEESLKKIGFDKFQVELLMRMESVIRLLDNLNTIAHQNEIMLKLVMDMSFHQDRFFGWYRDRKPWVVRLWERIKKVCSIK